MGRCSTCQNEYDKTFEVVFNDDHYTFDCFECAIHLLAPPCAHCGCRIIGHGAEVEGVFYCCAHCAHVAGQPSTVTSVRDRAGASA